MHYRKLIPHPGNSSWPKEVYSTVIFTERDKQTELLAGWKAHLPIAIEANTFAEGKDITNQDWGGLFDMAGEVLSR